MLFRFHFFCFTFQSEAVPEEEVESAFPALPLLVGGNRPCIVEMQGETPAGRTTWIWFQTGTVYSIVATAEGTSIN